MKRCALVATVLTTLIAFNLTAVADERVDKVIKELEEKFAKVNSYADKSKAMSDVEFGPNHTEKSEMLGASEWVRKGDKILMRSEVKATTVKTEDGKTTNITSTSTMVSDGEFFYTLTEEGGKKTVIKSLAPEEKMYHPKYMFDQYRGYADVKLLPDEQVSGNDCYVFEVKTKPVEGAPPSGWQVIYYQKASGTQAKFEAFDANGKLISSSVTTAIKINPDISEDRFKFEIPEGAQVTDMTSMQQPQVQPEEEAAEPEAEEAEKEEPKKPEKKKKGLKLPKLPKRP
jgi:outer membrane lipoprotein-sorting protein